MRAAVAAAAAALAALPGAAAALEAACRFDLECIEAEPCAASGYALAVAPGADGFSARLEDTAGTVPAELGVTADGATYAIARDDAALRLLTVAPGGAARYTLHLTDGPLLVSYLGMCE